MMSFWKKLIWYASRLATASSLSKSSRWLKTQISRPWYFETIFDWCLGACWPKIIHFQEHFWVIILSLDRNDINNFRPKCHLSKAIPILRSDSSIWKALYGTCRCLEQMSHKKNEKRTKEKIIVMSCTWKIRLSLNKNQECQKKCQKMMKNRINTNHFPLARNHSSV